ncbi:MAG TPA: DegT/DnrJ/EryC1/StrS family aminotransferase [Planctomycetota bacterium]|nr:DegT/DnrJ/EryC1/StrS family aminotransferase [Planctomycetota bacterium]
MPSEPQSPPRGAPIAPLDLAAERAELGEALPRAVLRVLESGRYVLGPEVEAFEREFAEAHGARHAVGVASGTDALVLALLALGVEPGDGVVTSPFTFFASAAAIAWIGARPVLADIDPETGLLEAESAASAVDRLTRCLLPVHLYGQLADVRAFRELADARGLSLLEDGAQAHGARRDGLCCGALGDAAAFSFYVTKNLGAAGEGGLVATRHAALARTLRELRDHGSPQKYVHARIGTNSRLQALQAAVLRVKLPHLERWNERRRALAARYGRAFEGSATVRPLATVPGGLHAYHQYAVRIAGGRGREAVRAGLERRGITAAVHYPTPVHLQEAAREWGYGPGDFPAAEALAREVLCLPIHPFLSDADVERVAEAVLELAGD